MSSQVKNLFSLVFILSSILCFAQGNTVETLSDEEIKNVLINRVNDLSAGEKKVGIVVGLINSGGSRIISEGYIDEGGLRKPDGNTVFEIASVTKVFSGLLLAQMTHKGEIELNAPVSTCLPKGVRLPIQNGRQISMIDLATHTSGLAFMPDVTAASSKDLFNYLSSCKLNAEIGKVWDYSNTGYWLMSEALSNKAASPFAEVMLKRIIRPLQLSSTGFTLTTGMQTNLATGFDASLQKAPLMVDVPNYNLMPAAGLLYSTANDLLKVLSVSMGFEKSSLTSAVNLSLSISRPISDQKNQALGWIILGNDNEKLIYHDGISAGYAACMLYSPKKRAGVVVLSNQATDVSDLAHHIIDPTFPLSNPKIEKRIEIKLDPGTLHNYVGKFRTADGEIFTIKQQADNLLLESPPDWGLPVLKIHPESSTNFFMEELPMKIIFSQGSDKKESIMIYPPRRQDGIQALRTE